MQFSQHKPVGDADGGDGRSIAPRGPFASEDEYRRAVATKAVNEGWTEHIWHQHWQIYAIATFSNPVSAEQARRAGAEFIRSLGPACYGLVAWGEGAVGGRHHIHLLLGGLWQGRLDMTGRGLNHLALTIQLVRRKWRHGIMTKAELFDASRRSTYLVDHHEVEVVGRPKRHRVRRRTESSSHYSVSLEPKDGK